MTKSNLVNLCSPESDDHRSLPKWHNENRQYFSDKLASLESHPEFESHLDWYKQVSQDTSQRFFVVTIPLEHAAIYGESCETGETLAVGTIGLNDIDFRHRHAKCDWFLIAEEYKGKGYGKDALLSLLHFAFVTLELHKVYSEILTRDSAAFKIYESLGFRSVGFLPHHVFEGGEFWNVTRMAVLSTTRNGFRESESPVTDTEKSYLIAPSTTISWGKT